MQKQQPVSSMFVHVCRTVKLSRDKGQNQRARNQPLDQQDGSNDITHLTAPDVTDALQLTL